MQPGFCSGSPTNVGSAPDPLEWRVVKRGTALERISREKIVELDDDRRAATVSNLLVVLFLNAELEQILACSRVISGTHGSKRAGSIAPLGRG